MLSISSSIVLNIYLGLMWITDAAFGQTLPEIPCPQYFQYVKCQENSICGLITLPPIRSNMLRIRTEFSIPEYLDVVNWGKLSPMLDKDTTANNVRNGIQVSYRVDFPRSNRLPKLTGLRINDQEINACLSAKYQPPKADFHLEHALLSNVNSLQSIDNIPNIDSFNNLNSNNGPFMTYAPTKGISDDNRSILREPVRNDVISNNNDWVPREQNSFTQRRREQPPRFDQMPPIFQRQPSTTEIVTQPTQPTTRTRRPIVQPQPNSFDFGPRQNNDNENNNKTRVNYSECGVEGTGGLLPFIHEGTLITKGQFPWLATIYRKEINALNLTCGGTLISTRSVITAAHCFRINRLTANQILVYLGRYDLENYSEDGVQAHDVQTLLGHPDYNTVTLPDADIAILQLRRTVEYSMYVRPICLWTEPNDLKLIEGSKATVAGWGADEKGNLVSPLPKMAESTIVSQSVCADSWDKFRDLLSPRSFCAGDRNGSGPCKGDSGGGLMIKRNDRWILRGIVVAGRTEHQMCDLRHFIVYCDVAKHMEWVQQNILN